MFLNLTMVRAREIHWRLPFQSRVLRAQISTNLRNLLTDIAPAKNKKMKLELSFQNIKWTAGEPSLVNSATCFSAMLLSGEITRTLALGFADCLAKQNPWYIKLSPKPVSRIAGTLRSARIASKASNCSGFFFSGEKKREGNTELQSAKECAHVSFTTSSKKQSTCFGSIHAHSQGEI